MMTDSLIGGVTYQANPAESDITDFNPTTDRLDFGEISIHDLNNFGLKKRVRFQMMKLSKQNCREK